MRWSIIYTYCIQNTLPVHQRNVKSKDNKPYVLFTIQFVSDYVVSTTTSSGILRQLLAWGR